MLYNELKISSLKKTRKGSFATSASVLEDLAFKGHKLPGRVLDWRQLTKLKNTYTEWEDYWEDGKLVSRITEIRYDNQAIKKIPNSIADLDSLRWLELQNNQIEIIPGYIGSLKNLQYFTIFQNNITELPPQIGYLSSLEVLKISENNLENIHQNIGELNNLNLLWLSENQITTLPDNMCNILENPNIQIYIDNNFLCPENNNECFEDLINNSTQPNCSE